MDDVKKLASDPTKTIASSEEKRLASDKSPSAEIPIPSLHPQVTAQVETGSRKERIRKATLEGGLKNIPNGFDDKDGDWAIIKSENPFEVLYLDHEQYKSVTPEMVKDNFGILSDFWDGKIHQMMSSSATKTQIIQKYGGEQGTEKTIQNYKRMLERAHKQLQSGIEKCFLEIDAKRRETGERQLESTISGILADGKYEPTEKDIVFLYGRKTNLRDNEITELLIKHLEANGFYPLEKIKDGANDNEKLSVVWVTKNYKGEEKKDPLKILEQDFIAATKRDKTLNSYQFGPTESATTAAELAAILKKNLEKGKKHLYSWKLSAWVNLFNQGLAVELDRIIEDDYPQDQDAGIQKAIYILNPDEPYSHGCRTAEELADALEAGHFRYINELQFNSNHPFYLYLEAHDAKKEADTFRKYFKTFSANKALNTIILELRGRESFKVGGEKFFSPEELLKYKDQQFLINELENTESRLSLWIEGSDFHEVKKQVEKWRKLDKHDEVTIAYALSRKNNEFLTDKLKALNDTYIIPGELNKSLQSEDTTVFVAGVDRLWQLLKDNLMLTKDKYKALQESYFIPEEIGKGVMSESATVYYKNVKFLRGLQKDGLLLRKDEYELLKSTFIIPDEIIKGLTDEYEFTVRILKGLQKDNLLLKKDEYGSLMKDYILPAEVVKSLASKVPEEYKSAVRDLRTLQKDNLLIKKDEFEHLITYYIIPDAIKSGIRGNNYTAYDNAAKHLRKLQNNNLLIKITDFESEWQKLKKRYREIKEKWDSLKSLSEKVGEIDGSSVMNINNKTKKIEGLLVKQSDYLNYLEVHEMIPQLESDIKNSKWDYEHRLKQKIDSIDDNMSSLKGKAEYEVNKIQDKLKDSLIVGIQFLMPALTGVVLGFKFAGLTASGIGAAIGFGIGLAIPIINILAALGETIGNWPKPQIVPMYIVVSICYAIIIIIYFESKKKSQWNDYHLIAKKKEHLKRHLSQVNEIGL